MVSVAHFAKVAERYWYKTAACVPGNAAEYVVLTKVWNAVISRSFTSAWCVQFYQIVIVCTLRKLNRIAGSFIMYGRYRFLMKCCWHPGIAHCLYNCLNVYLTFSQPLSSRLWVWSSGFSNLFSKITKGAKTFLKTTFSSCKFNFISFRGSKVTFNFIFFFFLMWKLFSRKTFWNLGTVIS